MDLSPSSSAWLQLLERENDTLEQMVREYHSGKYGHAPWKLVPASKLVRIWEDTAKIGFVRDSKGLDSIREIMVHNVVRLAVNTAIAGHTSTQPDDILAPHFAEEEQEAFVSWAIDIPETGGWRISDYGLPKLSELAALALETEQPEKVLVILDMMLNVAHQRSDLASWFVEGGSRTLSDLAEGIRPSVNQQPSLSIR